MAKRTITKAPPKKAGKMARKAAKAPSKALKPSGATINVLNVNTPGRTYKRNAEKYRQARKAYLAFMPVKAPGLTQAEMFAGIKKALPEFGSTSGWWMKTVQLDAEARGEVVRARSIALRSGDS